MLAWWSCGRLGKINPFVQEHLGQLANLEKELSMEDCPFINQGQYKECANEILCPVHSQNLVIRCVVFKDSIADVFMPQ